MADAKKSKKWLIIGGIVALVVIGAIVWFAADKKKKELAAATPTDTGKPSVDCATTGQTWLCPNDKDGNPKTFQNEKAAQFGWHVENFITNMSKVKEGDTDWDWKKGILDDTRLKPLNAVQRIKFAGANFHGLDKHSPDFALEFEIPDFYK